MTKLNVFITGGTSGLGLEVANHYLKEGANVAVCSFEDEQTARTTIPSEFSFYQADVTDVSRIREVIYDFKNKVGSIDVVIANAGISMEKKKIPDFERGRKVIQINVIGVLNTFEPAIEIMKVQGSGQIAALSSIAGTIGGIPGMAIYGASKSAVYTLCESLEIDLASFGIQVTCLAPGFIDTPLTKGNPNSKPFLVTQEKAGEQIYKALKRKKGLYLFPYQLNFTSQIMRRLPRGLYKWIMKNDVLGSAKS